MPIKHTAIIQHLVVERELSYLKDVLEQSNTKFIVYKGPHVAAVLYDPPALRTFHDLDILIHPKQSDFVKSILLQHGYSYSSHYREHPDFYLDYYQIPLISPFGVCTELHKDLAPYGKYKIDLTGMFKRAVSFKFGSIEVLGLEINDLFISLCVHCGKSYFQVDTKSYNDIALLIPKIDWDVVLQRANKMQVKNTIWQTLQHIRKYHYVEIPKSVVNNLTPSKFYRILLDKSEQQTYLNKSIFKTIALVDKSHRLPKIIWRRLRKSFII